MKHPISNVPFLLLAIALLLSVSSVKAETCEEKRDACIAACDQKPPAQKALCIKKCKDEFVACGYKKPTPLVIKDVDFDVCLEGRAALSPASPQDLHINGGGVRRLLEITLWRQLVIRVEHAL